MTYLTVPRPIQGRLKESIPIFMDETTAVDRLRDGVIKLIPNVDYPEHIKRIAAVKANSS